ncbi:hypothetical protein CBM2633_P230016 [Cupriavidus taiwanensis]|uniref:Uncharacterized protein n=2 Tax=Cupriavidus TaxID=106589 RepID=A0A375CMW6_9BURK|nr:hypothetical protein CBM2592_P260016 [Cupriavidus taiwanensis]SOZ40528.1 hypothetical protein CBM2605_P230014 [Cupriavidus neocaledonicus]SOY75186.1 hypothetical protein CBM2588_P250014 [Cupriavidus taiwanensis]SOY75201.1 hypothetical protein CBM2585_P230015 [Cupriavidus taiwanensis]SOY75856.1 hypothetical protein CBM2589_P230015 [Cupriavidus taiwanensis]
MIEQAGHLKANSSTKEAYGSTYEGLRVNENLLYSALDSPKRLRFTVRHQIDDLSENPYAQFGSD